MAKVGVSYDFDGAHLLNLSIELACLEKAILIAALQESKGIKAQAARMLCLNRTTFVEKCRKYDLLFNYKGDS